MKLWIPTLMIAVTAVGCQTQQKPTAQAMSPSVLDVGTPAAAYQPSAYTPPAYTPPAAGPAYVPPANAAVAEPAPEPIRTQTPVAETAAVASAGSSYTIKKGDTLYRIAREHYGDGKQWRRIAAANPGVTPTSLKVGQVLVMP